MTIAFCVAADCGYHPENYYPAAKTSKYTSIVFVKKLTCDPTRSDLKVATLIFIP